MDPRCAGAKTVTGGAELCQTLTGAEEDALSI